MIEWTFLVNSALDASRPLAHLLQYLAGMHSESLFPVLYFRSQNFYSNWVFALVQLFVQAAQQVHSGALGPQFREPAREAQRQQHEGQ